jgi:glyoxylase-like metal-dependent hydrolase (beta-lactamase superfamily II)
MRIACVRSFILASAALTVLAVAASAQAPTDYSKVEIKTTKVTNNFYTLEGAGGMIGIFTGPDGVLMVDAQFPQLTDKLVAAIKQISSGPIRFLVNTHVHADHTSGDANFAKLGAIIFAREELRNRLIHPSPQANGAPGVPVSPPGLPVVTYTGRVHWHMNGDDVQLIPIPRAHTDGDTLVYFPGQDVIMCGDFFRSVGYPNIDRANGGSLNGMLAGLGELAGMAGPNTKIIPGHGPTVDRSAVVAHRDMILAVRDRISKLVDQGKTPDEVIAAKPTADFDAKVPQAAASSDRFVGQMYAELKAAK